MVLRLEADRMTGLVLDDSAVAARARRKVILEQRRTRIDNEPFRAARASSLNGERCSSTPPITARRSALGIRDAAARHRGRARTSTAAGTRPTTPILVVAGDVTDTAEVRPPGRALFRPAGGARRRPNGRSGCGGAAAPCRYPARNEERARAAQPSWRPAIIWHRAIAPARQPGTPIALEVLDEILGGGDSSAASIRRSCSTRAGSRCRPAPIMRRAALGPATFAVFGDGLATARRPGVAVRRCLRNRDRCRIAAHRRRWRHRRRGAAGGDQRMQAAAIYARDSPVRSRQYRRRGAGARRARPIENDVTEWPDRIGAVTAGRANPGGGPRGADRAQFVSNRHPVAGARPRETAAAPGGRDPAQLAAAGASCSPAPDGYRPLGRSRSSRSPARAASPPGWSRTIRCRSSPCASPSPAAPRSIRPARAALAAMAAALLDEGAGTLRQHRLPSPPARRACRPADRVAAGQDEFNGSLRMLKQNLSETAELLARCR